MSRTRATVAPGRRWRLLLRGATLAGILPLAAIVPAASAAVPTAPPPITVLTPGGSSGRDIFITPTGDRTTYANGPEIVDRAGGVVWFHAIPQNLTASDFRIQRYLGHRVLTWWQGTGLGALASGTDYIYNDHYQQIATVKAGNGLWRPTATSF